MAELAALQKNNSILNVLDPPKDLNDKMKQGDDRADLLGGIIRELFWPYADEPPTGFAGVKDTKEDIRKALGSADKPGTYSAFFTNKANQIAILRDSTTSGVTAKPSGLNVAQDAGPRNVVENPTFLITPGTVLDPASKEKNGTYFMQAPYNEISMDWIKKLNLQHVIPSPIKMVENADGVSFTVTIPVKFGADEEVITARLLKTTFKPAADDTTADYFKGNEVKAKYIKDNYAKISTNGTDKNGKNVRNEIKKYLLVKELGDTLQVQWLNYIFEKSANAYNKGNTVIITNDVVVMYRAIINGVAVLLTYGGKSILYRATGNEEDQRIITAALITTIQTEVMTHNKAILKTIGDAIEDGRRGKKWLSDITWEDAAWETAKQYLTALKTHLENLNNDFDIYFKNMPSLDAAEMLAARAHFICPFVYNKDGYYKIIEKVTYLLQGGSINFNAKQFKPSTLSKLSDSKLFQPVVTQAGGGRKRQRGGARTAIREKQRLAAAASTKALIEALIAKSISEFTEPWVGAYSLDPAVLTKVEAANSKQDIPGDASRFLTENFLWLNSIRAPQPGLQDIKNAGDFLYLYVRDFYPEIFSYA
jgi:hypothetical protein